MNENRPVKQVLDLLGPNPGSVYYHLQPASLEQMFAEDRRQGLDFHDIWMDTIQKDRVESNKHGWILSISQDHSNESSRPYIQVLGSSSKMLAKYVLLPLLELLG